MEHRGIWGSFLPNMQNLQISLILGSRNSFKTPENLRLFTLEHVESVVNHLHDIKLVINLAGPFKHTQNTFIEACIQTGTHYIDISGEASDFEAAYRFDTQAKKAGIMIMTGAGFGVVPTEIAAKLVHDEMPDAIHLILAYVTVGSVSRGTLKTVLKDIDKEGIEIKNGKAVKALPAKSDFHFEVEGKRQRVVYNPWRGDLFTAQYSTKIPNIETYSNFPGLLENMMKGNMVWLRNFILKRLIALLPEGPSEKALKKGKTYIYAEAKNLKGEVASVNIIGPEAYIFTAQTLTSISLKIMDNDWKSGFQTPSLYGKEILQNPYQNVTFA